VSKVIFSVLQEEYMKELIHVLSGIALLWVFGGGLIVLFDDSEEYVAAYFIGLAVLVGLLFVFNLVL
jgi:hypothetical protein